MVSLQKGLRLVTSLSLVPAFGLLHQMIFYININVRSTLFGNRFSAMVQTFGQLAISAMAQLLLQTTTAAQIPLYPESHTEGYKFDALLYAVPLTFHLYFLDLLK